jgi:hypothetical protein
VLEPRSGVSWLDKENWGYRLFRIAIDSLPVVP